MTGKTISQTPRGRAPRIIPDARTMKPLVVLLLFVLGSAQQGCVAWRYTTTPQVTGRVLDSSTGRPIAGAIVGFRKHEAASTRTDVTGHFQLASDHAWGPAIGIPFEFTPCGGVLYVTAPGYETDEKNIGDRVYSRVELADMPLRKTDPQSGLPNGASSANVAAATGCAGNCAPGVMVETANLSRAHARSQRASVSAAL